MYVLIKQHLELYTYVFPGLDEFLYSIFLAVDTLIGHKITADFENQRLSSIAWRFKMNLPL